MGRSAADILFQFIANNELRDTNPLQNGIPAYVGDFKPKPGGWQEGYIFWRTQYMRRNPNFVELVKIFYEYLDWREKQKTNAVNIHSSHIGIDAITIFTDILYHNPHVAELYPMPIDDIIRIFDSNKKVYPAQIGLLFDKSTPFRASFLNFEDEPHTLKVHIDYTKEINHIVRYVATHVLLAQGLINETHLEQIYAAIPEKYNLGDQVLSALFTDDDNFPVSYNQSSDMGRAIGLWLWEHQQQHPEMPKTKIFANLAEQMPDKARDYKELSQYLKCTTACVEAMQVLKHSA